MDDPDFLAQVSQLSHQVLEWVGFGTLAGLLAKAVMPGRDPGGAVVTIAMGVGGSVIGGGILAYFKEGLRIEPISPLGFLVATGGAFVLLAFYRLMSGRWIQEGERRQVGQPYYRRSTRRRQSLDREYVE